MSLINDMLKDLDARRPGRRRSQAQVLEGLGASRPRESGSERMLRIGTRISFVLLVVVLGVGSWSLFAPFTQVSPGCHRTRLGRSSARSLRTSTSRLLSAVHG